MSQSPVIFDVTSDNFDQLVIENSHHKPVLVDFWAEWCAPCKALMPVLASITESLGGELLLAKVDCDAETLLTERFGIRSLPTVVLFKDGQPVDGFAGIQPESAIRALLEPHVAEPQPTADSGEDVEAQVSALLEAGQPDQAIALLQQAMADEPSDPLLLLLARALLDSQQFDDTETVLGSIQDQDGHKQAIAGLRAALGFARQTSGLPPATELQQRLASDPADSEAAYQLAIHQLARSDYEAGLEGLLRLMQHDRGYDNNSPQRTLLQAFDVLGNDHPLSISYRRKLYQLLY